MGSLVTAVDGQLAADAGNLALARERHRAGGRTRGDAARPGRRHIDALAALAPVQATLGDADAAAETLRSARAALRESPSPGMFGHLLDDVERRLRGRRLRSSLAEVEELSAREMSVLRLLGSQLSIAEIGDELYISRNTVKTHVRTMDPSLTPIRAQPRCQRRASCACSERNSGSGARLAGGARSPSTRPRS